MGKYRVCVYAICKNEEKFVRRWMESMREADEIYVLDTGSEDDTVKLLQELGAKVTCEKIEPWRFDVARNHALALVDERTDICVSTDLDEVFHPGWRAAMEKAWGQDIRRLRYRYTWNFNPDGSEGCVFWLDQVHARHGFYWVNPVHEILQCDTPYQTAAVEGVQLDHHADNTKPRTQYLPLLELAVKENPLNDRNVHYLGREYMFYRRWDDCIRMLQAHLALPGATWPDERCASMRYLARAYEAKGERKQAMCWLLRAIAEAPHLREPWLDAARFAYRGKDWDAVTALCLRALAIEERPQTYINEAASFGSLPYDLLSLGYYYTGRFSQALSACEKARMLAPQDERIAGNLALMQIAAKKACIE